MKDFMLVYTQLGILVGIIMVFSDRLRPFLSVDNGDKFFALKLFLVSLVTTVVFVVAWPLFVIHFLLTDNKS